jgi:hypothetical protein
MQFRSALSVSFLIFSFHVHASAESEEKKNRQALFAGALCGASE